VANAGEPKGCPFFAFCIDTHDAKHRSLMQQAEMLKELGYDGVGHLWLDNVAERLKTLDETGLKLYQITIVVDVTPGKRACDPRFKDVLPLLKGRHVQFDLLMSGGKPSDPSLDPHVVKILREMSDLARDSGSQLLLYPHVGCWVERIEDAVRVAAKVDRPNVGVMFNLCHWLRVDRRRDYRPLLQQAMPRLWAVSINGADQFDPQPGWAHYLQPLDRGSFDVGALLRTLKELGYQGPIGLQCYGIGGDAREHLARSMAAWRKLNETR
jgi:sugar phosphate isomerase/epimerase